MTLIRALLDIPDNSEYMQLANKIINVHDSYNRTNSLIQWVTKHELKNTKSIIILLFVIFLLTYCTFSLFREDTMTVTLIKVFLRNNGKQYLHHVLSSTLTKISQTKKTFEVRTTALFLHSY